jgi:DNA-binding NarL/FixJ family response regulator
VPNDPESILPYLAAGAVGYLGRDTAVAEWIPTLHLVADGQAALSPELAARLIQRIQQLTQQRQQWQHTVALATTLTPREREILLLLQTARSNAEMAAQLGVSVGTVKNHMHSILHKLALPRRADVKRYLPYLLN